MAAASLLLFSCAKDGEMLTATIDKDGATIGTADTDIVLLEDMGSSLALTLWWDELGNATLSNPDAQMTDDVTVYSIQFSTSEDFGTSVEQIIPKGSSNIQFTAMELNNLLSGLGLQGEVPSTIYIRICTALGTNTGTASYGNTISITVTPYTIDMSRVRLVGFMGNWGTDTILPATTEKGGEYAGFVHVASWYNFYFVEGNGTIWGGYVDGNPFPLEQKAEMKTWNAWFPEPAGCYYVTMSTSRRLWECTSISEMTLTPGSSEALKMNYSGSKEAFYLVFATTADNQTIQLDYTGGLYNSTTGTGSYAETSGSIAAAADGTISNASMGTATGGITTAEAGTYTLFLRMTEGKWELHKGAVDINTGEEYEPGTGEDMPEFLYLFYSWNTADGNYWPEKLASTLHSPDRDGHYTGYFSTPETWDESTGACYYNFTFSTEAVAADGTRYGVSSSDSHSLAEIVPPVDGNAVYAAWPAEYGLTRITVDMNTKTWAEEALPLCVSGTFNAWSLSSDPMTFDYGSGTWQATCEITEIGDGIQIVLGDNWQYKYGGSDGKLVTGDNNNNIKPEATGIYLIKVNLGDYTNMTYSLELQ